MRRYTQPVLQASTAFLLAACGSVTHGHADGGGEPGTVSVAIDGSGEGRVTSDPPGIDCPGSCSAEFAGGTAVALVAERADGSAFAGFAGACSGLDPACTVQVDGDQAVDALFALSGEKRFAVQIDAYLYSVKPHPSGDLLVAGVTQASDGIYLARLSSADGSPVWEQTYPGVDSPSIALDADGGIVMVGMFFGSPTFGGETLTNNGDSYDFFAAGIDPENGAVTWVDSYGGAQQDDARSVSVTADGRVYLGGPFWSPSVQYGDHTLMNTDQDLPFTSDLWVGTMAAGGAPGWATAFGGTDGDGLAGLAFDHEGNALAVGSFGAQVSFGDYFFTAADYDGFAMKLRESDGQVIWARQFGAAASDFVEAVEVDPDDHTVVAGSFTNTQSWGGSEHTPVGAKDIFLARYTAGGAHDWSTSLGGNGSEHASELAIDLDGNPILVGYFDADMNLGGDDLGNAGGQDVYVVKLMQNGDHAWSYRFGGGMDDYGQGAAVDRWGVAYVLGTFRGTADVAGESFETDTSASFLVGYWP